MVRDEGSKDGDRYARSSSAEAMSFTDGKALRFCFEPVQEVGEDCVSITVRAFVV